MKTLILVSLLGLFFAGCGHSDSAPATPEKWAQHDQNTFLLGCTETASASIPASTTGTNLAAAETIVDIYCNCVLTAVMAKYSAADFSANSASDSAAIAADGTTATCQQTAQQ